MIAVRVRSLMLCLAGMVFSLIVVGSTNNSPVSALPGAGESTLVSISPVRILDTRDPVNVGLAGPFVSPFSQDLLVTGTIATTAGAATVVPAGATGVLMNVTVVSPTADGFLSIRPANATGAPTTSSLNFTAGATVPNSVQVALPTAGTDTGKIEITYDAYGVGGKTADVLIDVVGYMVSSGLADVETQLAGKANKNDIGIVVPLADAGAASFIVFEAAEMGLGITTFTTPVAGQLLLSMDVTGNLNCASGVVEWWIRLDGSPVPSSYLVAGSGQGFNAGGLLPVSLEGITAASVAAGPHTIRVDLNCPGASNIGTTSSSNFNGSVTILDAASGTRATATLAATASNDTPRACTTDADGVQVCI